nr:MAG TPA: KilA protein [Caudoviricetes sp.]
MNSIQNLSFNSVTVSFRQDGFLNASAIAKHFGKAPKDYLKSEQTQQYIAALAENLSKGRKIPLEENQLVIVKHGGNQSGTWLHPKLAIHFARWLDPRFAVWCDEQIEHILSGSLKLEAHSMALSAQNIRRLSALFNHLPFMLAYANETQTSVCSLKPELVFRTHDRFQDGYIAARQLADSLGLPMRSWRDVQLDMFR